VQASDIEHNAADLHMCSSVISHYVVSLHHVILWSVKTMTLITCYGFFSSQNMHLVLGAPHYAKFNFVTGLCSSNSLFVF